jgi:aerobic-type carbon monoxide dehydrogenase small subunit (CoxS/CutS family)
VTAPVRLRVNGRHVELEADPMTPLHSVVHDQLGLRSVRAACGVGACGACTVLLDGEPARSCLVPVGLVGQREITTSEVLPDDHPVRRAFVEEHAYQCGYCIPAVVLATTALLERHPAPDADEIDDALVGNLCRCGSYAAIRRAVAAAVAIRRAGSPAPDAPISAGAGPSVRRGRAGAPRAAAKRQDPHVPREDAGA